MKELNKIEDIKSFIKNNDLAFIYVSSKECSVCSVLLPKIEELLKKYPKIQICHVRLEEVPEISGEYSIFTIPVLILFIQGKETIRESRYVVMEELDRKVARYYNMFI